MIFADDFFFILLNSIFSIIIVPVSVFIILPVFLIAIKLFVGHRFHPHSSPRQDQNFDISTATYLTFYFETSDSNKIAVDLWLPEPPDGANLYFILLALNYCSIFRRVWTFDKTAEICCDDWCCAIFSQCSCVVAVEHTFHHRRQALLPYRPRQHQRFSRRGHGGGCVRHPGMWGLNGKPEVPLLAP